jgi:hypothetical protein
LVSVAKNVSATALSKHDPTVAFSSHPSQLLSIESLRRPHESALPAVV